jgi:hypothetical protein
MARNTFAILNGPLKLTMLHQENSMRLITTFVTLIAILLAIPVWAEQKAVTDAAKCTSHDKADYGEKNYLGDLGKNWSVGTKATASFFRYNLASEKASFNDKTLGIGLSFRYYTDNQLKNTGHNDINDVPRACRARTEDLLDFSRSNSDGTLAKAGSWISFSPTLFVSKTESEGDVAIQPAIVIGLLNDIISIGAAYNLTGTGRGQWSIIVGPSYGFQW